MSLPGLSSDRLRRLTASVLVVLYAFLATVGTSLVICQEADGHVALEWRGAACCDEACPSTRSAESGPSASAARPDAAQDCFACRDEAASSLLVSRSAACARSPSLPSPSDLPVPAVAVTCVVTWTVCATDRDARPRAEPMPPPPLASIRTVVMRC